MDSPTERMPIACVHCAKAKAKCDKKVSYIGLGPWLEKERQEHARTQARELCCCYTILALNATIGFACTNVATRRFHAQDA